MENKALRNIKEIKINRSLLATAGVLLAEVLLYICYSTLTLTKVVVFIFVKAKASDICFSLLVLSAVVFTGLFVFSVVSLNKAIKTGSKSVKTITPVNSSLITGLFMVTAVFILLFKTNAAEMFLWIYPCLYVIYIVKNMFSGEAWLLMALDSAIIVALVYLSKAFQVSVFIPKQSGVFILSPVITASVFAFLGVLLAALNLILKNNKGVLKIRGGMRILPENAWYLAFILLPLLFSAFIVTILILGIRPMLYAILGFIALAVASLIVYMYRSVRA